MKAFVVINFMGAFAFDEKGKMIAHRLFPKKPEEIAKRLQAKERGESVKEELEVIEELGKSGHDAVFSKPDVDFDFRKAALEMKWVRSHAEFNQIMTRVNVLLTRGRLKVVKSDRVLMQAVGVADELDRFLNVFTERLREWYGLYSTDEAKIESNEKFVKVIAGTGKKELDGLKSFAKSLSDLYAVRKGLGKYIEKLGKESIPNLTAVAGPILAARLLEYAGGLEKLAKMSSSKLQLLGAEKALFRHLRGEGKPPKYGLLFSHPHVHSAPKELKGKIARLVAAKLSLAARVDFFSKEDRSKSMKRELDRQVKNLIG